MRSPIPFIRNLVPGLALASLILPVPAVAQEASTSESGDGIHGFVALGVGAAPEFEGASDYEPVPLVVGQLDAFGLSLEVEGLTARLNPLPDSALQVGPVFNFRPGRDDVSSNAVDRLASVDDAVEVGGFLRYRLAEVFAAGDELELGTEILVDVSGAHEGLTATLGGGYAIQVAPRWRLGLDAGLTFASDDYQETYFGIDAADSARSGLAAFDADGGLKDIGLGATVNYSFSERWGVVGRAAYTRLVGDAADSPIVEDEGSPNQFFAGLGISFRF